MNKKYIRARKKVIEIKRFYIHLGLFLFVNSVLILNLITIEKSENMNFFVWLILTTIVTWSIGLLIHAWCVFDGKIFFSKDWEQRKIEEFLQDEH